MNTELKRFNISVSNELDEKLNRTKKEYYSSMTHNDMIKDLIALGLEVIEKKSKK